MSGKIAIAIVHGICVGNEFDLEKSPEYTGGMAQALKLELAKIEGISGSEAQKIQWADTKLGISAVNWTPVLREERKNLYQRLG